MTRSMVHVVLALCLLAAAVQRARTQGEPERDVRVCEIDSEDQPVKSALCIASNARSYSHIYIYICIFIPVRCSEAPEVEGAGVRDVRDAAVRRERRQPAGRHAHVPRHVGRLGGLVRQRSRPVPTCGHRPRRR